MKIKYIIFFVPDVEAQVKFYIDVLGFTLSGKVILYNETRCPVLDTNIPGIMLIITKRMPEDNECMLVIVTPDCLSQCRLLKADGIEFNKEPLYLPVGLAAEFFDKSGNKILLLEERAYETSDL